MGKEIQPLVLEYLDEIAAGDINFKKDLIKIFLEQVPEFVSNMKKFYSGNDFPNLAKEAHTAKSSVLIFGMEETGSNLKKIQEYAEEKKTELISELLQKVVSDLENIVAPLNNFIGA